MEPDIRNVEDKRLQNPKIQECVSGRRSRHAKSHRPGPLICTEGQQRFGEVHD